MKTAFSYIMGLFMLMLVSCQEEPTEKQADLSKWNWSENKDKEAEHLVVMSDALKSGNLKSALQNFEWLIHENPKLNVEIYKKGLTMYDGLIERATDPKMVRTYQADKEIAIQLMNKYF